MIYEPEIDWGATPLAEDPERRFATPPAEQTPLRYTAAGVRIAFTLADGTDVLVAPPDGSTGVVRWLFGETERAP